MKPFTLCVVTLLFSSWLLSQDEKVASEWEISATSSETSQEERQLTFRDQVKAVKKEYEISCDKLVLHLDENAKIIRMVATGDEVVVELVAGGKVIIGKGKKAEYDLEKKTTTITGGPPFLQAGESYINSGSEEAKIVIEDNGNYKVTSPARKHIGIPIDILKNRKPLG